MGCGRHSLCCINIYIMQLRPYQLDALPLLRASMSKNERIIYVLPTGGGKTIIFSELIRVALLKGSQVLAITHRIELFKQAFDAIASTGTMIAPQVIHRKAKIFDKRAPCTVAMVETLDRRIKKGLLAGYSPDLVIIDECHEGNFSKIITALPNAKIIGFTATPAGKHLYTYYTDIVQHIDIPELIKGGWLLPCYALQMQDDFSDVDVVRGEYDSRQLYAHHNKSKLYAGVIDKYKEVAMGMKTLIFNVNIEHAHNMSDEFNAVGIRSEAVTSRTSETDRARILKDFSAGRFLVLNNCGILTTGYDEPSIECIVVNRATKSLKLWLQMNGRGSRTFTFADGSKMKRFMCIDFGMNHDEHGRWCEPRQWKLKAPRKKNKDDVAPVKDCPECDAMLHAAARVCEFCGYIFPIKTDEDRNGVLVEIDSGFPPAMVGRKLSDLHIIELVSLQRIKKYKSAFIWRIVRSRGEESILEYARVMKYRNGWVKRQLEDVENCTFTDFVLR